MGNLRRASGLLRYALFWGLECTSKRVHSDTTGANEQGRRQRQTVAENRCGAVWRTVAHAALTFGLQSSRPA